MHEVSHEQAVEQLTPALGEYAGWYIDGWAQLAGHPQRAAPTVEQLLRRPATTFAQWAVRHAAEFR